MDPTILDILIAIFVVTISVVAVVWFPRYKVATSEKRIIRMLARYGVDPDIIKHSGAIIKNVHRRCRKCQVKTLCERWLDGDVEGENTFCPNAQLFNTLKRTDDYMPYFAKDLR